MRLFVAIELPEDVREDLADCQGGVPGADWTLEENLHLTLRFVGDVDNGTADDLCAALDRVDMPPFDLRLTGVDCFDWRGREARALWAGVETNPELVRLQGKVEQAARAAGLPAETRRFHPHVTLARLRNADPVRLGEFLQRQGLLSSRPFTVEGFTLFSSHLGKGPPVYRPEAEFVFTRAMSRFAFE